MTSFMWYWTWPSDGSSFTDYRRSYWPTDRPHPGTLGSYEGIAIPATSVSLAYRWMKKCMWPSVPAYWESNTFEQQVAAHQAQTGSWLNFRPYTDLYDLRPGDIAVLLADKWPEYAGGEPHYAVVHSVGLKTGVRVVDCNHLSGGSGDGQGWCTQLTAADGLIGCFRASNYLGGIRDARNSGGFTAAAATGAYCYVIHNTYDSGPPVDVHYEAGFYAENLMVPYSLPRTGPDIGFAGGSLTVEVRWVFWADDEGHLHAKSFYNGAEHLHQYTNFPADTAGLTTYLEYTTNNVYPWIGLWEPARIGPLTARMWDNARDYTAARCRPVSLNWQAWHDWQASTGRPSYAYTPAAGLYGYYGAGLLWESDNHEAALDGNGYFCFDLTETAEKYPTSVLHAAFTTYGLAVGEAPYACTDRSGRTKLVYLDGADVKFRHVEQVHTKSTWGTPVVVYQGTACTAPCAVAYNDGGVSCWYLDEGAQKGSYSTDDGETWTAMAANFLGHDLTYLHTIQHHGITYGVGIRMEGANTNAYLVRSQDQGRTQVPFPGGATEILVGVVSSDCRPCLVSYADGQMVVYAADATTGATVVYASPDSGFQEWAVVA